MPSYVITGGPGSGKTTLLRALANAGYLTVPEVSRTLIRKQVEKGSDCLPWPDLPCFARKCLDKMVSDFAEVSSGTTAFFDRGIPDIIAYLRAEDHLIEEAYSDAACKHRYETKVFIAPPWEGIYVNDEERWQTFGESCELYEAIYQTYQAHGYEVIELPLATVEERVDFIRQIALK